MNKKKKKKKKIDAHLPENPHYKFKHKMRYQGVGCIHVTVDVDHGRLIVNRVNVVERRQLLHCYLAGLFIGSKYGNSTFL
jgi:hypothetical protein